MTSNSPASGMWNVTPFPIATAAPNTVPFHTGRAPRIFPGSCPTAAFCVGTKAVGLLDSAAGGAVVNAGLVTTTNPAGDPLGWQRAHTDPFGVTGVSCPSKSLCVAIDKAGYATVGKTASAR